MHFDGWHTMEGRFLVFAFAATGLIQAGYFTWIALQWNKLAPNKKAARP